MGKTSVQDAGFLKYNSVLTPIKGRILDIHLFYYILILRTSITRQVNHDIHRVTLSNIIHSFIIIIIKVLQNLLWRINPRRLDADALIFTQISICATSVLIKFKLRVPVMDESCSVGLYVKTFKHLATLWNYGYILFYVYISITNLTVFFYAPC